MGHRVHIESDGSGWVHYGDITTQKDARLSIQKLVTITQKLAKVDLEIVDIWIAPIDCEIQSHTINAITSIYLRFQTKDT